MCEFCVCVCVCVGVCGLVLLICFSVNDSTLSGCF